MFILGIILIFIVIGSIFLRNFLTKREEKKKEERRKKIGPTFDCWSKEENKRSKKYETIKGFLEFNAFICGVISFSFLFVSIIIYTNNVTLINKVNSVQMTIDIVRTDNDNEIERAALVNEILSLNVEIDSAKRWNENWFIGGLIPNEINNIKRLE